MRHLPFYGRWFRFVMTYPGIASGPSRTGSTPTTRTADGVAVNAGNEPRGASS